MGEVTDVVEKEIALIVDTGIDVLAARFGLPAAVASAQ